MRAVLRGLTPALLVRSRGILLPFCVLSLERRLRLEGVTANDPLWEAEEAAVPWLCEDGAQQLGLRWILALPRRQKPGLLPPPVQVC